jgi:branched-subunit amino acid aminotransferase/4-amino-4-deoxychorismate lyase
MECKMGKIATVVYNGKLLPETELNLLIHNRGFLYGDGFFESMRFEHGKILTLQFALRSSAR